MIFLDHMLNLQDQIKLILAMILSIFLLEIRYIYFSNNQVGCAFKKQTIFADFGCETYW